jgi:hypothetical protein
MPVSGVFLSPQHNGVCAMEERDLKIVEQYGDADPELKALWEEHMLYEKQIAKYEEKAYLTPSEQQELKTLKKQKLDGKTRLAAALDKYKK